MIKTIEIKRFKCFKELKLSGQKTLSVIAGKNNTGKTSILDALFAYHGVKNPANLINIAQFRKGRIVTQDPGKKFWTDYFHGMDESIPFEIAILDESSKITQTYSSSSEKKDNQEISLNINQIEVPEGNIVSQQTPDDSSDKNTNLTIKVTEEKATKKKDELYNITIKTKKEQINANINQGKRGKEFSFRTAMMITTSKNITKETIINNLSGIVQKKKKEELINYVKNIDNRINDIAISSLNNKKEVYLDIGLPEMTELSMMGEGIARALAFISSAIEMKNSIILIDEIENGIHYSAIEVMIKSLIDISKENKNQIFTTTHSGDVIRAISNITKNNSSYENDISYTRIGRDTATSQIKVEGYDMDEISYSLEQNWEVR